LSGQQKEKVGAKNVIQNNANFQGTTFNHNLTGLNVLVTQTLKTEGIVHKQVYL